MWLGLIASFLLLVGHIVRHGLGRGTPTSRLNVRLLAALRGFLDDVLTTRARERELREQADSVPELEAAPKKPAAAAAARRPGVRASVKERAAHWRAMTPAKLARAEQMADERATQAEIARKLGVSRSTVSRHLSGKV